MEHSGFPSDETLAAFIDGRLDDVTRRRVVEHMTTCDECYAVYLAATEMQKASGAAPPHRRVMPRHFWAATLTMSIAAVLAVGFFLRPQRHPGVESLVAATRDLPYRTTEGRLSGFNAWKPLGEIKRDVPGEAKKDPKNWRLLWAAAEVEESTKHNDSAENLHALGVSHLLLGNFDEAIGTLQLAAGKSPGDAAIANDLANAYLARGVYKKGASDFVEAAERAKHSWQLKKTPEAAWTRAVAFEHMHLEAESRAAWNDYLALDRTSPWRGEAERRVNGLGAPTDAARWKKAQPLLERAAMTGDTKEIARIAADFPSESAGFAEEKLSAWANGGDESFFNAGERISAAVAPRGFGYMQAICAAIRASSPEQLEATKQASHELERGRKLFADADYAAAHKALTSARELALRARSPLAQLALLQIVVCSFYENDDESTTRALDILDRELDPSATVLRARAAWLRGLTQVESGHPYDALRTYELALALATSAGCHDWQAALNAMVGQSYQILGDPERAWQFRLAALQLAMKTGHPIRLQYVLMEATVAAVFYERRRELGEVLTRRLLEASYRLKSRTAIADAHIWRARYLSDSGVSSGLNELHRARVTAAFVTDADSRDRLMANLEMAEGELLAHDEPKAAVARLTESLRFLDRSGNHLLRAQAYSARANAHECGGDRKGASLDRAYGIAEVEAQRGRISDEQLRIAFVTVARRLYTDEVDLAVTWVTTRGHSIWWSAHAQRRRAWRRRWVSSESGRCCPWAWRWSSTWHCRDGLWRGLFAVKA